VVARQINALGSATAKVSSIDVFGSYVAGAAKLSDIDLIVGLPELGPHGPEDGVTEQLDVLRKLKASKYVSIHVGSDSIAAASDKVRLFP
jgi:predicted nucleotidyltransferase